MSSPSNKTNEKQEEESKGENVADLAGTSMSIDDLADTVRINMDLDTTFTTPTSKPNDVASIEKQMERQLEMLTPEQQQLLLSRLMQQKSRSSETEIISPVATNLGTTMEVEGMLTRARVSRSIMDSQSTFGPSYAKKEAELPEVTWGFQGDRRDLKNSLPTEKEKTIFAMATLSYLVYQFSQNIGRPVVLSTLQDIANSKQASVVIQVLNQPKEFWYQVLYMRNYSVKAPLLNKDFGGLDEEKQEHIETMYYQVISLKDELMQCVGRCEERREEKEGKYAHWLLLILGTSIFIEIAMSWEKTIMLNNATEEALEADLEQWLATQFTLLARDDVMVNIVAGQHNEDECFAYLFTFGIVRGIQWGRKIVRERREQHQASLDIFNAKQLGLPSVGGPFSSPPKPIQRKMPIEEEEEDELTKVRRELEEMKQSLFQFQQSQQANSGPSMTRSTLGTSLSGQMPGNGNAVNINIVSQADQVRIPSVKFDPSWFDGKPTLAKFTALLEQGIAPWMFRPHKTQIYQYG